MPTAKQHAGKKKVFVIDDHPIVRDGLIAVLLPYSAENYPLGIRGRATGLVAGSSKFGGVAVQGFALAGFIPTLTGFALALLGPIAVSTGLIAWAGRETRGRSLRELEAGQ